MASARLSSGAAITAALREQRVPLHLDAVQAAGWLPLSAEELGYDAISLAGHKLGTPKGIGVLGGVGYDIPIGTSVSITPVATFQYGIMGDANGLEDVSLNIISLAATLTLH